MKKNELLKHYGMTQNTSLTDDELMLLLNYLETENDKLKEQHQEEKEQLEQLRWIQNDVTIGVTEVDFNGIEINTPQDLERWKQNNG